MTVGNHTLPVSQRSAWSNLSLEYKRSRASMDLAYANEDEDRDERSAAHSKALDAVLLMPSETLADLRFKIEVMDREDVADGWWCAQEAMALVAIDARRLLPIGREHT
jgi:hypothetical protein